jgi:hypothetical protein
MLQNVKEFPTEFKLLPISYQFSFCAHFGKLSVHITHSKDSLNQSPISVLSVVKRKCD